ncbi:hypothetical protein LTR08_001921 [Meristemomyces frigidus]|nr:hypothetical protein LTR08_001921 [Meristemomyces frigidus]
MALNFAARRKICQSTIAVTASIVAEESTRGATNNSTFITSQLPSLSRAQSPGLILKPVGVLNGDSLTIARNLARELPNHSTNTAARRVAVLNLASDELPGGGWPMTISTTQEEALCYSSTLFATLKQEYYPWPNTGPGSIAGVYSPGVVVFRKDLEHACELLPKAERDVVAVITVAAPRYPELSEDEKAFKHASDLQNLRDKIRLVYRMAASHGHTDMVLGAVGCGAYGCPREVVAKQMRLIFHEDEFAGWFENVLFAVYGKGRGGAENFEVFRKEFECEDSH